jgi:hypothetical protein
MKSTVETHRNSYPVLIGCPLLHWYCQVGPIRQWPWSKAMWWEARLVAIRAMPDPKSRICKKCHQVIRTAKGGLTKHQVHCKAKQTGQASKRGIQKLFARYASICDGIGQRQRSDVVRRGPMRSEGGEKAWRASSTERKLTCMPAGVVSPGTRLCADNKGSPREGMG